jgi:hypothetical protein
MKRLLVIALCFFAVAATAYLFIRNNSDVFLSSGRTAQPGVVTSPNPPHMAVEHPRADTGSIPVEKRTVQQPEPGPKNAMRARATSERSTETAKPEPSPKPRVTADLPAKPAERNNSRFFSVDFNGIVSPVADRPDCRVTMSLKGWCGNMQSQEEILLKREDIRAIWVRQISEMHIADVAVEKIKPAMLNEANRILHAGGLADIDFGEFRIDRKKR